VLIYLQADEEDGPLAAGGDEPPSKRAKYKKMHDRAKDFIDGYLGSANTPV